VSIVIASITTAVVVSHSFLCDMGGGCPGMGGWWPGGYYCIGRCLCVGLSGLRAGPALCERFLVEAVG
jgi:hypothetical protein